MKCSDKMLTEEPALYDAGHNHEGVIRPISFRETGAAEIGKFAVLLGNDADFRHGLISDERIPIG